LLDEDSPDYSGEFFVASSMDNDFHGSDARGLPAGSDVLPARRPPFGVASSASNDKRSLWLPTVPMRRLA
jgi:hypothetical protein